MDEVVRERLFPKCIKCDQGKEFLNQELKQYLAKNKVNLYPTRNPYRPQSQSLVERFNLTLKKMIFADMHRLSQNKDPAARRWHDRLQGYIYNYNNRRHSRLGMRPAEAVLRPAVQLRGLQMRKRYNPLITNDKVLRVGTLVRVRKDKKLFEKVHTAGTYSAELYRVATISPGDNGYTYDSYSVVNALNPDLRLTRCYLYSDLLPVYTAQDGKPYRGQQLGPEAQKSTLDELTPDKKVLNYMRKLASEGIDTTLAKQILAVGYAHKPRTRQDEKLGLRKPPTFRAPLPRVAKKADARASTRLAAAQAPRTRSAITQGTKRR